MFQKCFILIFSSFKRVVMQKLTELFLKGF